MTLIGKINAYLKLENCSLFSDFKEAEHYVRALIKKDIQYSDGKYITLAEAIKIYGDNNLSYYNGQPLNSIGWISKNPDGAIFGFTFNPEFVTR